MKLGLSLGRKHQIFISLILTRKRKTTNMPCHPEAIPLKQFEKGITTNHTPNYNRINAQSGIQLFRGGQAAKPLAGHETLFHAFRTV
jgi:hypothetical protein